MVVDSMSVSELIAEVLKDWYDNALPFYSKKMSAKVPKYRTIKLKYSYPIIFLYVADTIIMK